MPTLAQETTPAGASATEDNQGLEDIIVTAQRKPEDLQRAAIQVNVIGGEQLSRSGATEVRDLQTLVPNVIIEQAGPNTQISVRGIGSVVTNSFGDSAVAFNVDEVYIARTTGTHGTFYDLDRVEVLKGPQGTLYGRNATAGAVNVITAKPSFDRGAAIDFEYGSFNQVVASTHVNLPLSDSVAIRASGQAARRDGYYRDGYDDEDVAAGRLQLRYQPNEDFDLLIAGDYSHEGGRGSGFNALPFPGGDPWAGPSSTVFRNYVAANLKPPYSIVTPPGRTNLVNLAEYGRINHKNYGVRGRLDWTLGAGVTWTSIAAYRVADTDDIGYNAAFATSPNVKSQQVSIESRLAGNAFDTKLQWLAGLYYFRETQRGVQFTAFVDQGNPLAPTFGSKLIADPVRDTTYAAFTQNSFSITDRFRVTAGLRYFGEIKTNAGSTTSYSPLPPVLGSITIPASGRIKDDKMNYRAGIEFDVAPRSMLYATIADGYKAGGFFAGSAPSTINPTVNSYAPETLTSYFAGMKNRFLDNRLQLNAEIFYWKYSNRQFVTFGPINTGTAANISGAITQNVGKSHIQGASADISFQVAKGHVVSLVGEYIDEAINDDFVYRTTLPAPASCTAPSAGVIDCSGAPITRVPRWSATVSYQGNIPLNDGSEIAISIASKLQSGFLLGPEGLRTQEASGYSRTDASVTYTFSNGQLSIGAFVRNLEDNVTLTAGLASPITNEAMGDILPPRTYGLRLGAHF
ncbi:MAG: TonB-dependent receptor [Sphingobium sp.]|nr:TonB-dependent receptor [Sphingobium sp.]